VARVATSPDESGVAEPAGFPSVPGTVSSMAVMPDSHQVLYALDRDASASLFAVGVDGTGRQQCVGADRPSGFTAETLMGGIAQDAGRAHAIVIGPCTSDDNGGDDAGTPSSGSCDVWQIRTSGDHDDNDLDGAGSIGGSIAAAAGSGPRGIRSGSSTDAVDPCGLGAIQVGSLKYAYPIVKPLGYRFSTQRFYVATRLVPADAALSVVEFEISAVDTTATFSTTTSAAMTTKPTGRSWPIPSSASDGSAASVAMLSGAVITTTAAVTSAITVPSSRSSSSSSSSNTFVVVVASTAGTAAGAAASTTGPLLRYDVSAAAPGDTAPVLVSAVATTAAAGLSPSIDDLVVGPKSGRGVTVLVSSRDGSAWSVTAEGAATRLGTFPSPATVGRLRAANLYGWAPGQSGFLFVCADGGSVTGGVASLWALPLNSDELGASETLGRGPAAAAAAAAAAAGATTVAFKVDESTFAGGDDVDKVQCGGVTSGPMGAKGDTDIVAWSSSMTCMSTSTVTCDSVVRTIPLSAVTPPALHAAPGSDRLGAGANAAAVVTDLSGAFVLNLDLASAAHSDLGGSPSTPRLFGVESHVQEGHAGSSAVVSLSPVGESDPLKWSAKPVTLWHLPGGGSSAATTSAPMQDSSSAVLGLSVNATRSKIFVVLPSASGGSAPRLLMGSTDPLPPPLTLTADEAVDTNAADAQAAAAFMVTVLGPCDLRCNVPCTFPSVSGRYSAASVVDGVVYQVVESASLLAGSPRASGLVASSLVGNERDDARRHGRRHAATAATGAVTCGPPLVSQEVLLRSVVATALVARDDGSIDVVDGGSLPITVFNIDPSTGLPTTTSSPAPLAALSDLGQISAVVGDGTAASPYVVVDQTVGITLGAVPQGAAGSASVLHASALAGGPAQMELLQDVDGNFVGLVTVDSGVTDDDNAGGLNTGNGGGRAGQIQTCDAARAWNGAGSPIDPALPRCVPLFGVQRLFSAPSAGSNLAVPLIAALPNGPGMYLVAVPNPTLASAAHSHVCVGDAAVLCDPPSVALYRVASGAASTTMSAAAATVTAISTVPVSSSGTGLSLAGLTVDANGDNAVLYLTDQRKGGGPTLSLAVSLVDHRGTVSRIGTSTTSFPLSGAARLIAQGLTACGAPGPSPSPSPVPSTSPSPAPSASASPSTSPGGSPSPSPGVSPSPSLSPSPSPGSSPGAHNGTGGGGDNTKGHGGGFAHWVSTNDGTSIMFVVGGAVIIAAVCVMGVLCTRDGRHRRAERAAAAATVTDRGPLLEEGREGVDAD
jgi:hypothetical protein